MNKEWVAPAISVVCLGDTADSNQPDMPSDGLYLDFYNVCDKCS